MVRIRQGYAQYIVEVAHKGLYDSKLTYETARIKKQQHVFISGGTRSGKSTLIQQLVFSRYMYFRNRTVTQIIIDPEGGLADRIARFDHQGQIANVLHIDMKQSLNILDSGGNAETVIETFSELLGAKHELTPAMESILRPCIHTLIIRPDSTLSDLMLFMDAERNEELIKYAVANLPDEDDRYFIEHDLVRASATVRKGIADRLRRLLTPAVKAFLCRASTFDLSESVHGKRIIVFNLKGDKSHAIGRMLIAKISSLLEDRSAEVAKNNPVLLYVDEAHEYITQSLVFIVKRMAKRGLYLTLATQRHIGNSSINAEIVHNIGVFFTGRKYGCGEFKIKNNDEEELTVQCSKLPEYCYMSQSRWEQIRDRHQQPRLPQTEFELRLFKACDNPDQSKVIKALDDREHLTVSDFIALGIKPNKPKMNKLLAKMKGDAGLIKEHKKPSSSGRCPSTYTLR